MNKTKSDIVIFILSMLCMLFFSFSYLNYSALHYDNIIFGVLTELLTIPLCLIIPILLIFSGISAYYNKFAFKNLSSWSFLITLILLIVVCGGFLFKF